MFKFRRKVAVFEKVSWEQFYQDCKSCFDGQLSEKEIVHAYNGIRLPERATYGSAGYDFFSPVNLELAPQSSVTIPTGVKCKIKSNFYLGLYPKSGLGFKFRMMLNNTIGIVDSDYYYSDNDGHIMVKIINDNYDDKMVVFNQGDKFVQGIFSEYFITENDAATKKEKRNGGFGSTN